MVKTTLELRDDLYKKLMNESMERYGNTKSLSKVVNENLESHLNEKESGKEATETKGRKMAFERAFGGWKMEKSGKEYVREIRDESERRRKRLGL